MFYIGAETPETDFVNRNKSPLGADITGNGIPDLVISEWTGGAHCCFNAYVFELGDGLKHIGSFEGGDFGVGFEDLDGDGVFEVTVLEPVEYGPGSNVNHFP